MVFQEMEFHNVEYLEREEHMSGLKLHRFPEVFGRELGIEQNRNGRFRAGRPHGCEIRFATDIPYFNLALTAVEADLEVLIYCGDYFHQKAVLKAGVCTVLQITEPPMLSLVEKELLVKRRFDFNVWRIQFGLNGYVYFNYLNTFGESRRPPRADEKPACTWLAYGSSITCGSAAGTYSNAYINQAAEELGIDVLNKGLSGSCLCEDVAADYLARAKCDLLTLELGVNMVPFFAEDEFEKRVSNLLRQLACSPAKEIYVIDMFPCKGLIFRDKEAPHYRRYRTFKEIVGRLADECGDERVRLIRGEAILDDFSSLTTDFLHPSDRGHIRMGRNLADAIRRLRQETRPDQG